jgi:hypothetical protein
MFGVELHRRARYPGIALVGSITFVTSACIDAPAVNLETAKSAVRIQHQVLFA